MRRPLFKRLRKFRDCEDGSIATIEFLFWFPFFVYVAWSGIDLGMMSFNHANLERALDETIREVRLNRLPDGETDWDHDLLKDMVCDRTYFVSDCSNQMALEMTRIDPRVGNQLNPDPICVDSPADLRPLDPAVFQAGTSNELMIIRACLEVEPLWGFTMVGDLVRQNGANGQWELQSTTVFVHEPLGGNTTTPAATNPPVAQTGG